MNAFELLTYQDKVCNVLALECDITPHKGALILIISCEKIPSVVIVKRLQIVTGNSAQH